jgi:hypothetical protein
MLPALLQGPAKKIYCATGLLLLLMPLYCAFFPVYDPVRGVSEIADVVCVTAFSCVFAFLQDQVALSARAKTRLACSYAAGTLLLMIGFYPSLYFDLAAWTGGLAWGESLVKLALLSLPLILLPVGAVFLGVLRSPRRWPERAYMLAGLCLTILYIGTIWFNLFGKYFGLAHDANELLAWLVRVPAHPLVALAGLLLGCAPHQLHRPAWLASAVAVCYLVAAAALVPLGLYAGLRGSYAFLNVDASAIVLGFLVPASFVIGNWAASAFTRRPR